mgnify:CR=1 FL=1
MIELLHGDCLELMKDIPDKSIDLIVIDPPYIVTKNSWDKEEVVSDFLSKILFDKAKEHCSLYVWCGIGEKSNSLFRWFPIFNKHWYFKDLITWKKQRGMGNKKGWLYVREECMWFVKDNKQFTWNKDNQYDLQDKRLFSLPNNKSDFKRFTNVWIDIKECAGSMKSCENHPTEKPVELIQRILKLSCVDNGTVLDCFMGSGSTGVACINTNRNFIGIEKDDKYFEIAKNRIEQAQQDVAPKV